MVHDSPRTKLSGNSFDSVFVEDEGAHVSVVGHKPKHRELSLMPQATTLKRAAGEVVLIVVGVLRPGRVGLAAERE